MIGKTENSWEVVGDYTPDKLAVMGEAASILLSSPSVIEFFRTKEVELFDAFNRLDANSTLHQHRDIVHKQNILSELLQHMRYLEQQRKVIIERGSTYGNKKEGGGTTAERAGDGGRGIYISGRDSDID